MKKFRTLDALINARARQTHKANLQYGGVFDEHGKRWSDLEAEKRYAASRVVYVGAHYAEIILDKKLSKGMTHARYIPNFGYVELK